MLWFYRFHRNAKIYAQEKLEDLESLLLWQYFLFVGDIQNYAASFCSIISWCMRGENCDYDAAIEI